jgi:hypothetical protein
VPEGIDLARVCRTLLIVRVRFALTLLVGSEFPTRCVRRNELVSLLRDQDSIPSPDLHSFVGSEFKATHTSAGRMNQPSHRRGNWAS